MGACISKYLDYIHLGIHCFLSMYVRVWACSSIVFEHDRHLLAWLPCAMEDTACNAMQMWPNAIPTAILSPANSKLLHLHHILARQLLTLPPLLSVSVGLIAQLHRSCPTSSGMGCVSWAGRAMNVRCGLGLIVWQGYWHCSTCGLFESLGTLVRGCCWKNAFHMATLSCPACERCV
jgi:hypothetical protein